MDYDEIDPKEYDSRSSDTAREDYMRSHWRPFIKEKIRGYCGGKRVLDLGCGTGAYTTVIWECAREVLGMDISEKLLKYARNKRNLANLMRADAHRIPLPNETFDIVVSIGLLEYADRDRVAGEVSRILRDNGLFIISVPNKYSAYRMVNRFISRIAGRKYQAAEPSNGEMTRLLEDNGFTLLEFRMDDGLVWLPDSLDKAIGRQVYSVIEWVFGGLGSNPLSNLMFFVARKQK